MVVKATTRDIDGVELDANHQYKFQQGNSFYVKDAGAAREIEQEYGVKGRDQVVVAPINMREPCHNYFFGPTRRYADAWESIFGKKPE